MDILMIIFKVGKVILFFVPLLWGIHFFLYTKNPKYYFKVSKLTSKWKDTNWNINAGFTIPKSEEFYKVLETKLDQLYGKGRYRRPFNLKNKKLYEFGDFALTVQYDMDVSQNDDVAVEFIFNNINVTVNTAEKKLKELRILFHELEKSYNLVNQWYHINIKFNSLKNPFYGLMIQRLGEEHVEYFECLFPLSILSNKQMSDERESSQYKLRVFKEYITINDSSFDVVEEVAKKCLLLR